MQIINYFLEANLTFDTDSIEMFLGMCEIVIANFCTDERTLFKLKSAAHELLTNSLEHGYEKNSGKVSFSLSKQNNSVVLEVCDEGKGFNTYNMNLNSMPNSLDSFQNRGLGLKIINKFSEKMEISPNLPHGTRVSLVISLNT